MKKLYSYFLQQSDFLLLQIIKKMGNQSNKMVLELRNQDIIIHNAFNMKIKIADIQKFPHGLDGLKLWEAGIVLSRYAVINSSIFKDKEVLQLGAGVGIAGITIKKWTEAKSIQMTDYNSHVVNNIILNCKKNQLKIDTYVFDWRQRTKIVKEYDLIIGSDIVYYGCPVKDLYLVFKEKLKYGGKGIIIIPQRKNYAQLFLKEIQKDVFQYQMQSLKNQNYFQSPLQDQEKAKFEFSLLWKIPFSALVITKIKK